MGKAFRASYELGLHGLALLGSPVLAYKALAKGKYRQSFLKRWGRDFPLVQRKGDGPLVWLHAVSVGETRAVVGMVKMLKERMPEATILVSNVTETGHQEAKKCLSDADYHVYLPFDFRYVVKKVISRVRPDVVLMAETDLWFNFMREAKKQGAKLAVINGKISKGSARNYRRLPALAKELLGMVDLYCVQGEDYSKRFDQLGVQKDRLRISGNLKLDGNFREWSQEEKDAFRQKLKIKDDDSVVVIGSTHEPEERELLLSLLPIWRERPELKVIIAPRHPERFGHIAPIVQSLGLRFGLHSQAVELTGEEQVIILDAMGMLRDVYSIADVAAVGGSWVERVGGHNILEPSAFGIPVLYGPQLWSQPDLLRLAQKYEAGIQVESIAFGPTVLQFLSSPLRCQQVGKAGRELLQAAQGSTERTWKELCSVGIFEINSCQEIS